MHIEWAQSDQPVRGPNPSVRVHQPSAVPSGAGVLVVAGCVSFPWCVGVGDVMCSDVVCDVMWLAAG